jgi:hypothetical protein
VVGYRSIDFSRRRRYEKEFDHRIKREAKKDPWVSRQNVNALGTPGIEQTTGEGAEKAYRLIAPGRCAPCPVGTRRRKFAWEDTLSKRNGKYGNDNIIRPFTRRGGGFTREILL